jgi:hypothetical protein
MSLARDRVRVRFVECPQTYKCACVCMSKCACSRIQQSLEANHREEEPPLLRNRTNCQHVLFFCSKPQTQHYRWAVASFYHHNEAFWIMMHTNLHADRTGKRAATFAVDSVVVVVGMWMWMWMCNLGMWKRIQISKGFSMTVDSSL